MCGLYLFLMQKPVGFYVTLSKPWYLTLWRINQTFLIIVIRYKVYSEQHARCHLWSASKSWWIIISYTLTTCLYLYLRNIYNTKWILLTIEERCGSVGSLGRIVFYTCDGWKMWCEVILLRNKVRGEITEYIENRILFMYERIRPVPP